MGVLHLSQLFVSSFFQSSFSSNSSSSFVSWNKFKTIFITLNKFIYVYVVLPSLNDHQKQWNGIIYQIMYIKMCYMKLPNQVFLLFTIYKNIFRACWCDIEMFMLYSKYSKWKCLFSNYSQHHYVHNSAFVISSNYRGLYKLLSIEMWLLDVIW